MASEMRSGTEPAMHVVVLKHTPPPASGEASADASPPKTWLGEYTGSEAELTESLTHAPSLHVCPCPQLDSLIGSMVGIGEVPV